MHDPNRIGRMRKIDCTQIGSIAAAISFLFIFLCSPLVSRGDLEVNVTHVGFPSQHGDIVRNGEWTPIIVDVALVGQASFEGSVRATQLDIDGDEYSDSVELHLLKESGGTQRVFLYIPLTTGRLRDKVSVEVLNTENEAVHVVSQGVRGMRAEPAADIQFAQNDDLVVLSVSGGTSGRVDELSDNKLADKTTRSIRVAHLSPSDLPPLWIGLESIDCIVWDEASPQDLSASQLEALLTWVRKGGKLLIAASRTAGTLKLTKSIDAILPAEIGDVTTVKNLRDMREKLVSAPSAELRAGVSEIKWLDTDFPMLATAVKCKRRSDALVIWNEPAIHSDLITQRREGGGHVIYSGITLRDLFSAPGGVAKFYREVFHLLVPDGTEKETNPNPLSLFGDVVSAISFSVSGSAYLLIAAIFSLAYVALATLGTWSFLGIKGWRQHSWTAFAIVAFAASLASISVVGSIRGIGDRLHQIAIVDADAGAIHGRGTAFFGVKSGLDKRLDFWLPDDWVSAREPILTDCFLRPISADSQYTEAGSFADPTHYSLVPSTAGLRNVRLRGTLKEFEGRWDGPLGGKLTGKITVERGEVAQDSYVVNQLGVELYDCVLLRAALNTNGTTVSRDGAIYVEKLGDIPKGETRVSLFDRINPPSANPPATKKRYRLSDAQKDWSKIFRSIISRFGQDNSTVVTTGRERSALMLLSTINEFNSQMQELQGLTGRETWSRDRMRQLDISDELQAGWQNENGEPLPGGAMLIGFARGPGPIRLFARAGERPFQALPAEEAYSWTMYRIRIPVFPLDKASTINTPPKEKDEDDIQRILHPRSEQE